MTFDPETIPGYTNGKTVVQNVTLSPVFDSTTTYITGTTQYIDAFQRGNFWAYAQNNNYHLLLGEPSEVEEQELDVPMTDGCVLNNSVYGFPVGSVHDTWLGPQLQTIIASLPQIQPNSLVIFLSYDVVEFIGGPTCSPAVPGEQGQHYSSGAQTYVWFGYLDENAYSPAQPDVSILSHEVGEWADDPFRANITPCGNLSGGYLEVGDPLIGHNKTYAVNGFTYSLQDLAFLHLFGGATGISVNKWSFQNETASGVCGIF
jgi:hypothetical protein